jgi:hypothetical protein
VAVGELVNCWRCARAWGRGWLGHGGLKKTRGQATLRYLCHRSAGRGNRNGLLNPNSLPARPGCDTPFRRCLSLALLSSGNPTAVLFSLVATCQRHAVDPYLRDVLTRIAATPLQPARSSPARPLEGRPRRRGGPRPGELNTLTKMPRTRRAASAFPGMCHRARTEVRHGSPQLVAPWSEAK